MFDAFDVVDRSGREVRDVPVARAERELLVRFLKALESSTVTDVALWAGMYIRDGEAGLGA